MLTSCITVVCINNQREISLSISLSLFLTSLSRINTSSINNNISSRFQIDWLTFLESYKLIPSNNLYSNSSNLTKTLWSLNLSTSLITVKMMKGSLIIALVAAFAVHASQAHLPNFSNLDFLDLKILDKPIDWFLFDFIPTLLDQKPADKLPNREVFRKYLFEDKSNDDVAHLTAVSYLEEHCVSYL